MKTWVDKLDEHQRLRPGEWIEIGSEMRQALCRAGEWEIDSTQEMPPDQVQVYLTRKVLQCHPIMVPAVRRLALDGTIPPLIDNCGMVWRLHQ